jgi:hypothetical protein
MDRLVVRDLSQDGVEGSSAGVVDLLDAKEGLRRCLVLDEAFGTEYVDVAPEDLLELVEVAPEGLLELIGGLTQLLHVLHEPEGGYTDLLLEMFHRVTYLVKDRLRRRCRRTC